MALRCSGSVRYWISGSPVARHGGSKPSEQGPAETLAFTRALLELTVRENGEAMDTITRIFSEIASLFLDVERRCEALRRSAPDDEQLASVGEDCAAATRALRTGLRAMQLHDITDQRLSHVVTLLGALGDGRRFDIATVLTDDEERTLLRLIQDGVPGGEVLGRLGSGNAVRGSVELF